MTGSDQHYDAKSSDKVEEQTVVVAKTRIRMAGQMDASHSESVVAEVEDCKKEEASRLQLNNQCRQKLRPTHLTESRPVVPRSSNKIV